MDYRARKPGKVYLIGAGPGDPKLLTIKAAEALAESDAIVYDYLVNPEILVHARRGAQLIYAGKHAGEHSLSQSEINRVLIERARSGQTVARLKGGDPFIFGRGGEEAEALVEASVEWEVIPGISSGVAAAAYAGIPLTHRDHASSVAFITGHDGRKLRHEVDWSAAVHAADTLVIFMCAETIARIARSLIANGRAPSTPIALIRWGTYEYQEVYSGTLEEIAETTDGPGRLRIEPPAIAIVGDVVSLREKLRWFGNPALEYSLGELTDREMAVAEV
ncbi:MAG: uroporphyrinogen-III C-methyltransferase [Blastocatellia bacterium]|nr:uroporphyrinogen-III C-methyltransferase [Blastocatellia bacterium]